MDGGFTKFHGNVCLMTNTDAEALIFSYGSSYWVMGPCITPEDNKHSCYSSALFNNGTLAMIWCNWSAVRSTGQGAFPVLPSNQDWLDLYQHGFPQWCLWRLSAFQSISRMVHLWTVTAPENHLSTTQLSGAHFVQALEICVLSLINTWWLSNLILGIDLSFIRRDINNIY